MIEKGNQFTYSMNIKELISKMTLEEKAGMCSGLDFWHTKGVERLGIPSVMMTDGPHGLRKQPKAADHLGVNASVKAVCFPAGCCSAASFDPELLTKMGVALGEECQAEDVACILGPGATLKRSPLCGRNFEYFSEDPLLSTKIAAGHIKGVESQNVGTSIKHFFANNQETRRMTNDSVIDERTLHEIYLASFEGAIKEGKPMTVMCSYNKINGTYAAENHFGLTEVLRDLWGYEGFVVSDWSAVNDRVADLKAGLDLEMPASGGFTDKKIVEAVKDGSLDEKILDTAVERILTQVFRYANNKTGKKADLEAHHQLAKKIAEESMVLLKNEEGVLPIAKEAKVAFIGPFAKTPRYQGGGSSHINPSKLVSPLEAAANMKVEYAEGFLIEDKDDEKLLAEAVEVAKRNEIAVIFAGLPDTFESEGYDRTHLNMPNCQNKLISAVAAANPKTVVVLMNGSPIVMPWLGEVKSVLEAYIGGQAIGEAIISILFGDANPCGRLPETFPKRLEDTPCYGNFPGDFITDRTVYSEGVLVGYRWYDFRNIEPQFPFGFGLSYTDFEFSNLRLSAEKIEEAEKLVVTVNVKNVGKVAGKEVVQLYVRNTSKDVVKPVKELRAFAKVELQPGEAKDVELVLDRRAFAYWSIIIHDWHVESGKYGILIGKSSRNIVLEKDVEVVSARPVLPFIITVDTKIAIIRNNPKVLAKVNEMANKVISSIWSDTTGIEEAVEAFANDLPLRSIISFTKGAIGEADILALIKEANA